MSYAPNQTSVYLRAFAGFMAGITAQAVTDTSMGDYTLYGQMADAYAQQVDASWGILFPTGLELSMIGQISEAIWENRSPNSGADAVNPGSYTQIAQAVVARVLQGNAQVVSEGINPNGGGLSSYVVSPNGATTFATGMVPGTSGKLLAVAFLAPEASGLLTINANFLIVSNVAPVEDAVITAIYVPALTLVTGGSPIAPGLIATPASVTPAQNSGSAVQLFAVTALTASVGGLFITTAQFAGLPCLAPVGVRAGIVFVAQSSSNTAAWTVVGSVSVIEKP
jgi:hypothetical protein